MTTSYEHKGAIPGIEYGPAIPITGLDGRKFTPPSRVETKADASAAVAAPAEAPEVQADVPPAEALPEGTDATTWMVVPDETLTPEMRRAAEIALEAAKLQLPELPAGLQVRFIVPYDPSTYRIYSEVAGTPPATFFNAKGTKGTYFGGTHPDVLWVSVAETPTTVARATLHEAAHAWRQVKGVPAGWTQDDKEEEADAVAARLLPLVEAAAVEEGGLGTWPAARPW